MSVPPKVEELSVVRLWNINYQRRYEWLLEHEPDKAQAYWDKWARSADSFERAKIVNASQKGGISVEEMISIARSYTPSPKIRRKVSTNYQELLKKGK